MLIRRLSNYSYGTSYSIIHIYVRSLSIIDYIKVRPELFQIMIIRDYMILSVTEQRLCFITNDQTFSIVLLRENGGRQNLIKNGQKCDMHVTKGEYIRL